MQVGERVLDAMGRFEKGDGPGPCGEVREATLAIGALRGKKAGEDDPLGRDAACRKRGGDAKANAKAKAKGKGERG